MFFDQLSWIDHPCRFAFTWNINPHSPSRKVCLMKLVREVIALAGLLFVIPGYPSEGRGGEETRLDPELPYQAEKKDPVSYRVDFSIVLTAPYHTKLLRV